MSIFFISKILNLFTFFALSYYRILISIQRNRIIKSFNLSYLISSLTFQRKRSKMRRINLIILYHFVKLNKNIININQIKNLSKISFFLIIFIRNLKSYNFVFNFEIKSYLIYILFKFFNIFFKMS